MKPPLVHYCLETIAWILLPGDYCTTSWGDERRGVKMHALQAACNCRGRPRQLDVLHQQLVLVAAAGLHHCHELVEELDHLGVWAGRLLRQGRKQ